MSTGRTNGRWTMEVASYIDTDELVVEIRLDDEDFGVLRTKPSGPELTIYNCADEDRWTLSAQELQDVIARATTKLIGAANE